MPISILAKSAEPSRVSIDLQRSGIVVTPDGKKPRTLTVDTWKKILRLMRDCKKEGFRAHFTCPACQQPITMTAPHPTSPRLSCACTVWIGR